MLLVVNSVKRTIKIKYNQTNHHISIFSCSSRRMSLGEINENVKLAREYALLGNYSSAVVCYQGVLEQIKKYLYSVRDSSLQQKWQQVVVPPVYDSGY